MSDLGLVFMKRSLDRYALSQVGIIRLNWDPAKHSSPRDLIRSCTIDGQKDNNVVRYVLLASRASDWIPCSGRLVLAGDPATFDRNYN